MIRWLALALLLCLAGASAARADELRPGYLALTQLSQSDWTLAWKAPLIGGVTPATQPVLPAGCVAAGSPERSLGNGALLTITKLRCAEDVSGKRIGLSNLETAMNDVLVRVAPLGRPVQALRLTADEPSATIAVRPERWQVARTYFWIGVEHIVFGYDHLLFVVALVLLLSGFWTIAKAITAFTVAHSITLVGTTLGLLGLPQKPVEAVIALSILFLAVEIVKRKDGEPRLSERLPWLVAFLFGLLHGFGFAGALQEIGLPETEVPMALLTFNLGVEAGQIAIVAVAMGALWLLRTVAPKALRPAMIATSYAIGSVSAMWLIERVFL